MRTGRVGWLKSGKPLSFQKKEANARAQRVTLQITHSESCDMNLRVVGNKGGLLFDGGSLNGILEEVGKASNGKS